ncbi:MAG: hypothetical protein IT176_04070 [Acidobacteria bacterium]|nr:hypothetical protein [Acidobacteriota bacterium]
MIRNRVVGVLGLVCLLIAPRFASAQSFFDNYLRPEFLVPVSDYPSSAGGDLLIQYYQMAVPLFGNGEILMIGEFPRARQFSITAYDDHGALIGILNGADMQPYGASPNPFAIGGPAGAEDALYAVTLRLDNAMAASPMPQCATPFPVHDNVLDMRSRHTAGTYYSSAESGFSANVPGLGPIVHADAPANTAGFIVIRTYMRQAPAATSQFDLRRPLVWVRAASTGCAAPLAPRGQSVAQWFSLGSVLKADQMYAHVQHEKDLGVQDLFGPDPATEAPWFSLGEYLPGQAFDRYVNAPLPIDPATLAAEGRVMQLQFKLPVLPCQGAGAVCARTGAEELRYWGLTFEDAPGWSLASFSELALSPDADRNVTLVIGFGTPLPAYVTPANGYSRVDLPILPAARLVMRNQRPAPGLPCSVNTVPPHTAEYHPNGGYMGLYAPAITFPLASSLPPVATPLAQSGSCQYP